MQRVRPVADVNENAVFMFKNENVFPKAEQVPTLFKTPSFLLMSAVVKIINTCI